MSRIRKLTYNNQFKSGQRHPKNRFQKPNIKINSKSQRIIFDEKIKKGKKQNAR